MFKIDNNYTLEADKYQWILHYRGDEKIGDRGSNIGKKVIPNSKTFHGTIEQALKAYLDKSAKDASGSVLSILNAIQDAHEAIEELKVSIHDKKAFVAEKAANEPKKRKSKS